MKYVYQEYTYKYSLKTVVCEEFLTQFHRTRAFDLIRENDLLKGYFKTFTESITFERLDLIRAEFFILSKLQKSKKVVDGLKDFQGVSIPNDNQRENTERSTWSIRLGQVRYPAVFNCRRAVFITNQ